MINNFYDNLSRVVRGKFAIIGEYLASFWKRDNIGPQVTTERQREVTVTRSITLSTDDLE